MKKTWKILPMDLSVGQRFFVDLAPVIEQILVKKGLVEKKQVDRFFSPDFERDLGDPFLLTDMEKAVQRFLTAKKNQEKICVYGDYDADGVTSTSLLMDFFSQLGVEAFCYIPERNNEGYGMNERALKYIKNQGAKLIITVDCGISNYHEVEIANELGLDVIIIDHHHVPPQLPNALAVINPKRQGDRYPEKELAGVGVAFKFVQGLALSIPNYDISRLKWMLDLVAIGTIADCVPLLGENRVLAKFGLIVIAKTRRIGLRQLFQVARLSINEHNLPSSQNIAFQVAPRINAAGRIDHANKAYELLSIPLSQQAQARVLALEIEEKNQHRQKVTKAITDEVQRRMENRRSLPRIIIEADPHWELGVIGLAAGKIADIFHRPTILLKSSEPLWKGSGRSIKPFDLIQALEEASLMLEKYGGHRQAAGLSIQKDKMSQFITFMEEKALQLSDDSFLKQIEIDNRLPLGQINEKLLAQLKLFEPFGQENNQPVFLSENIVVHDWRLVGNGNKHLKLWVKESPESFQVFDAICFGSSGQQCILRAGTRLNLVYTIEEDNWNNRKKIQLRIVDMQVIGEDE